MFRLLGWKYSQKEQNKKTERFLFFTSDYKETGTNKNIKTKDIHKDQKTREKNSAPV